jgi:transposase
MPPPPWSQSFTRTQRLSLVGLLFEVGTYSSWGSRLLHAFGHKVIIANPRRVKLISASSRKDDRLDAQTLARLARVDPKLLRPIQHRTRKAQGNLTVTLVNTARGLAKSLGERLPVCDPDQMGTEQTKSFPVEIHRVLEPLMRQVVSLAERIKKNGSESGADRSGGLPGNRTPSASERSRDVGCYAGLRPRRSESGESQPQLRITKEGDAYLRKMLVQGVHYLLGHRGPDTDLKRWGLKLAVRGGQRAEKAAVIAVARKLGILLQRLWVTGKSTNHCETRTCRTHGKG